MKMTVYGAGYVGLVTSLCFAEMGICVFCADIDSNKIKSLRSGRSPIVEDRMDALLARNRDRIIFSTDVVEAIHYSDIHMIAVGTPSREDGAADLQFVDTIATQIGMHQAQDCFVIIKSTVPVGTASRVKKNIIAEFAKRKVSYQVDVISNPEFLREGRAIRDCLEPERIIIGVNNAASEQMMRALYAPWIAKNIPIIFMDNFSAELTKYAANAFLATKVTFMNEMSRIAECVGADIRAIKKGIGTDSRIGAQFLDAGCGFGGSCFPKDLLALKYLAESVGYVPPILNAVLQTNAEQQSLLFQKANHYFQDNWKNKTVALWGLAFKPNTDDVRSATSCVILELLWKAGVAVKAYDPLAMDNIQKIYPDQPLLTLCENKEAAIDNADALFIITEWEEFKKTTPVELKNKMRTPVIFDGRNVLDYATMRESGLYYFGIGIPHE